MDNIGFTAALDADPRPSFILDLDDLQGEATHLQPRHFNKSARNDTAFISLLTDRGSEPAAFRRWAKTGGSPVHRGPRNTSWVAYDIEGRWRVVQKCNIAGSSIPLDVVTPPVDSILKQDPLGGALIPRSSPREDHAPIQDSQLLRTLFNISDQAVKLVEGLDKHLEHIAAFDWSSTSIGAITSWPSDLLQLVHLILLDTSPQALFLTDNHLMLYNVAYAGFAGGRHPSIMGQSIFEAWKEAIELNVSILDFIDSTGCPFIMEDFDISLNRNGFLEEIHMKWTTVALQPPLRGYLCTSFDETARKVTERRKAFLSRVSEACRGIRDMSSYWKAVLQTVGSNGKDFPFAFIYSRSLEDDNTYTLEGILDCDNPVSILPATIDLEQSKESFVPVLRQASTSDKPVPVRFDNGTLPKAIVDLSEQRGQRDRCLTGLACPVRRASDQMTLGILVIGQNTRRTFDKGDHAFTGYMLRSLSDLATNSINAQESDLFAQQAATRQQSLINKLASTTLEADNISAKLQHSEQRFRRFAEHALCPVFMFSADYQLQFYNDAYRDVIGAEGLEQINSFDGTVLLHDDDMEMVMAEWKEAEVNLKSLQVTCRLKKEWKGPDGAIGPMWVVTSAYPETDSDGTITGWIGILLDVSQLKWAERVQELRMQEAVEAKRQQENFIDMTSHEIRNPLGAVVHCADSILASLVDLEAWAKEASTSLPAEQIQRLLDIYESSFDSASTIVSCSTHQRRIVEDVLTFSKLNSKLLKIMPSAVRKTAILNDLRNMFELDAQKGGVAFEVVQDDDCDLGDTAEWLMIDIGRLMQVLINLITNAIKFTREESKRVVTLTMGIGSSKPSLDRLPLDFVPLSDRATPDLNGPEWGDGETVYLHFIVEDTGCGLSDQEKSRIFSRFSQGNLRTHTKYGGSGLGLFISRELVELQCGEIGFSSQKGVGSKFGFFIKARRASAALRRGSGTPNLRSGRLSSSTATSSQRFSILVVEDNLVNQAVLSKQLRKLGHEVHVASDGVAALKFIQSTKSWRGIVDTPMDATFNVNGSKRNSSHQVDLHVILMDVEMPVMDGLSCATEIRRLQQDGLIDGHVPIIAVSANARVEQIAQAMECGMDDAISKPFRIVDLMPKIEKLVRKSWTTMG